MRTGVEGLVLRSSAVSARRAAGEGGFTLLEILIATVILTVVIGIAMSVMISSTRLEEIGSISSSLEGQSMRLLEEIAADLRQADQTTLTLTTTNMSSNLSFRRITGYNSITQTAYRKTNPIVYQVIYEGTGGSRPETNNGVDDNKNGLVDEGYVQKTTDFGTDENPATPAPMAPNNVPKDLHMVHWVREGGFTVTRVGTTKQYTLSLTLERMDSKNKLITKTYTTSATIRN